jgi:thiosulfate reductase cytochrome b subunit
VTGPASSIPPAAALGVLVRGSAPTDRAGTVLTAGPSSAAWGAFVFVFARPADDPPQHGSVVNGRLSDRDDGGTGRSAPPAATVRKNRRSGGFDADEVVSMPHVKAETPAVETSSMRTGPRLHPWPVRIMHWVNAVVMLIMITSGWGIYDDDVIIRGFHFSSFWRLGDWAAWSLNWHFAGMWFLVINGLIYLVYGFASGRFREKLLPIRPIEVMQTVIDTLHFKIAHEDITVYNGVQKLLYIIVILAGISQAITGIAIWKPVQFSGLVSFLGGFQTARVLHFAGMAVIVGFLIVHVALALLVPKTLWAMVTGGTGLKPRDRTKEGYAA